jgi:hypothetical protein
VPNYLVERYLPAVRAADVEVAIAALAATGGIRHIRATFVPEDETCFHVIEASSREAVRDALTRAAITFERIVEAVEGSEKGEEPRREGIR